MLNKLNIKRKTAANLSSLKNQATSQLFYGLTEQKLVLH